MGFGRPRDSVHRRHAEQRTAVQKGRRAHRRRPNRRVHPHSSGPHRGCRRGGHGLGSHRNSPLESGTRHLGPGLSGLGAARRLLRPRYRARLGGGSGGRRWSFGRNRLRRCPLERTSRNLRARVRRRTHRSRRRRPQHRIRPNRAQQQPPNRLRRHAHRAR